jgi:hypothetical protein
MGTFPLEKIKQLQEELAAHPVYEIIHDMDDLRTFMMHHVFSVWDFMSLVKYLQHHIAPAQVPWMPSKQTDVQRFINDIVLEEESDEALPTADGQQHFTSHFELYAYAMEEVAQGSSEPIRQFINSVSETSVHEALHTQQIPVAAKAFMQTTFGFIESQKPHVVAAAFALGREHVIPQMFSALLEQMEITNEQAPTFHYYLDRHISLDGDVHGPMSLKMLDLLCEGNAMKIQEAEDAAIEAIKARIAFWDGVLLAMQPSVSKKVS